MSTKTKLWKSFVATSQLYAKFDCPVAYQNFSLLATVHDCEIGLFSRLYINTCTQDSGLHVIYAVA